MDCVETKTYDARSLADVADFFASRARFEATQVERVRLKRDKLYHDTRYEAFMEVATVLMATTLGNSKPSTEMPTA